jgi:hypothetical protein
VPAGGEVSVAARKLLVVMTLGVLMVASLSCQDSERDQAERAAVEEAVRGYLFALADAYSTLDTSVLDDYASPNERAAVRKLLQDLLQKTGDRIDAELVGFDVQALEIFRGINATVRLIEVWNITRYGAGDGIEKGRTENSIQNTILQMRLIDGRWVCVGRSILSRETPLPDPTIAEEAG